MIEIPGYKIQRTLGKGGMAAVYLAIQESFEREVALKVMNPALSEDPKFSERFLSEAKIVSRLVHPNIVTVYDVGVHNQQHYLSMEYIPGQDLKHKRKHLRIRDSLQVVRDVARALDYASKKGYVHRDVKPENIMLHEEDGRAVLMDFGIACLADTNSGITQTGTAIGTPHYMSPEQAKGRAVDSRSDIYSLGVVLFLLVAGRVPFDADSAVAVGIKHVSEPVPRLPKTLRALQPIIDKVMAKEPANRYQTGIELIEAIDAIDPQEFQAIELLTTRSLNASLTGDTYTPTHTPTALSQAQASVRAAKHSPDQTTMAAAVLHTSNNTRVNVKRATAPTAVSKAVSSHKTGQQAKVVTGQQRASATPTATQSATKTSGVNVTTGKNAAVKQGPKATTERISAISDTHASVENNKKNWRSGESLYVDEDDRRDHAVDDSSGRRWPWAIAVVLVAAVAVATYFRAYLPDAIATPLERVAVSGVNVKNAVAASLGFGEQPLPNNPTLTSPDQPAGSEQSLAAPSADTVAQPQPGTADTGAESQDLPSEAGSLRDQLERDLSVAPQLAQRYRDTLRKDPTSKIAEWGLRDVREYHERNIRDALAKRDLATAQRFIASMDAAFPGELSNDQKFQSLRQQLEAAQRAQVHIDKAEQYLANEALSLPKGANAVESYRQALVIDPNNPLALRGLKQIVDRYVDMSRKSAEAGRWEDALQTARRGLDIDPANVDLIRQQELGGEQLAHRSKVTNLLSAAQEQMAAGNMIEPEGDSAYHRYRQLLQYDSGNSQALAGLRDVEQQLAYKVESFINQSEFDQANRLIVRIGELFSGSDKVEVLSRNLEIAREADFIARQPKITQLAIGGTRPASVQEQPAGPLKVDRTLYILFSYANFSDETSVLQAVLYDGSRSVQIAQVPVVVNGNNGEKYFQFDRPVEGFAAGGYSIDLILNDNKLRTAEFKVSNAN